VNNHYRIVLTASARRMLHKLPTKVAHACLEFLDGPLSENPYRVGKPLTSSWEGHYSARRGDWRIIYRIDDGQILVEIVTINHRADVDRSG
jgi:mRNA interferase RelE/StbE